jgi:hypothetical protein
MTEYAYIKHPDGTLEKTNVEIVSRPATDAEGEERVRRANEAQGLPFRDLPGHPPEHKIVGELADGFKVRAIHAETVFNDQWFIDYCCGEGHYEKTADARTLQVLALARKLYAAGES